MACGPSPGEFGHGTIEECNCTDAQGLGTKGDARWLSAKHVPKRNQEPQREIVPKINRRPIACKSSVPSDSPAQGGISLVLGKTFKSGRVALKKNSDSLHAGGEA